MRTPNNKEEYTVLIITHKANLYGAERCCLDLATNLPERIQPIVILPDTGPFLDVILKKGIEHYVIHFMGWWHKRFPLVYMGRSFLNLFVALRILKQLKSRKIDLVVTNTLYSPIGAYLAVALGVPHIWHAHEFTHLNLGDKFDFGVKKSMRFVNRFSNRIICTSTAHKSDLSQYVASEKLCVVHNGIELKAPVTRADRANDPASVYHMVMIGSINENKGHMDALMALKELIGNGMNVQLTIVGDGDERHLQHLKEWQTGNGLAGHVRWEGFRENTDDYLRMSDVLLLCSRFETFGRVAAEAMSEGCPVVASNSGGLSDIIEDGVNGFLYEHGDYRTLADRITLLMRDGNLSRRITGNALKSVHEKFSREKYISNMVAVMDAVMNPDALPHAKEAM